MPNEGPRGEPPVEKFPDLRDQLTENLKNYLGNYRLICRAIEDNPAYSDPLLEASQALLDYATELYKEIMKPENKGSKVLESQAQMTNPILLYLTNVFNNQFNNLDSDDKKIESMDKRLAPFLNAHLDHLKNTIDQRIEQRALDIYRLQSDATFKEITDIKNSITEAINRESINNAITEAQNKSAKNIMELTSGIRSELAAPNVLGEYGDPFKPDTLKEVKEAAEN